MPAATRTARMAEVEFTDYQRPAIERMLIAALDFASACNDYRSTQLWADDVTRHDFSTVDNLGGMLDQISDALGSARKRIDNAGGDPDRADLDLGDLIKAHTEAKARADARRGAALALALFDSLAKES